MRITQEQHELLTLMGFSDRNNIGGVTSYWHAGTAIWLECVPTLTREHYRHRESVMDVVVVVPNDISEDRVSAFPDLAVDVVRLKDLPQFMMYRAFSGDCFEHRLAREAYRQYSNEFEDAQSDANAATYALTCAGESLHEQAMALLAMPKPPTFRPVAIG